MTNRKNEQVEELRAEQERKVEVVPAGHEIRVLSSDEARAVAGGPTVVSADS